MGNISADREKAVDLAIGQIERQFGKGSIMKLGSQVIADVPVIPTGSLALDHALGVGGIPRGRVIELFGPESSGKTTLALHIVAEAQKQGGIAAFVDAEHALDVMYARKLGVNCDDLLVSQPDTGEQALEIAEVLVGAVPWMCWSLTRWQPWSQGQRLRATWEMPMWVCRPGSCPRR